MEEKLMLSVTLNPGIALTGFRTTQPLKVDTLGNMLLAAHVAVTVIIPGVTFLQKVLHVA